MCRPIVFVSLMTFCLVGCSMVRHYEVQAVTKDFHQASTTSQALLNQIRTDLKERRYTLHSLQRQGADIQKTPYAELNTLLNTLQTHARSAEDISKAISEVLSDFQDLSKGKKKISSRSPDYARVGHIKDRTQNLVTKLQTTHTEYDEVANTFVQTANEAQIKEIQVRHMKGELKNFLRRLDANISLTRSRASKIQAAALGKNRALYQNMTMGLARIEEERRKVSKLITRFNQIAGSQPTIWTGPKLLSFDILLRGDAHAQKIQAMGSELIESGRKLVP